MSIDNTICPSKSPDDNSECRKLSSRIKSLLHSQGIPLDTPCLKLEVKGRQKKGYRVSEEDVKTLFSNFGKISSLRVVDSAALVLFVDMTSAYLAQKILNGRESEDLVLEVTWYHNKSSRPCKQTCQFFVQLSDERSFHVARRIIGPKGKNMKKILGACGRDAVKIRLRGKGSGFKEGPELKEIQEPLHIWVSSNSPNKYKLAVQGVEKLLTKIYSDYKRFCEKNKLDVPLLQIKKREEVTGQVSYSSLQRLQELEALSSLTSQDVDEITLIRNEARRQGNFALADRIRESLRNRGVFIVDEKGKKKSAQDN